MSNLTSAEVEAYLGRTLTKAESDNFDIWETVAELRVEGLICSTISSVISTYGELPKDLALVISRYFGAIETDNSPENGQISSKKVEDFSITYNGTSADEILVKQNWAILAKYSSCGKVRNGKTLNHDGRFYRADSLY